MADVYCPKCGEPFDVFEFYDLAEELNLASVAEARRLFFNEGCGALGYNCDSENPTDEEMADISAVLYDILGDEMLAVASELEDYDRIRRMTRPYED